MENDVDPLINDDDVLEGNINGDETNYRTYKSRWYLLSVLAFLNISNGLVSIRVLRKN